YISKVDARLVWPALPPAPRERRTCTPYNPVARSAAGDPATADFTYQRDDNDDWNREVVQQPKGLWFHSAGGRVARCVCAHHGRRARRYEQSARRAENQLRAGERPRRQDLGGKSEAGVGGWGAALNAPFRRSVTRPAGAQT